MAHTLPALPYAPDALEPHIDAQTMLIHHGKHLQAYVNNLNAAIERAPELASWTPEQLCRDIAKVPESVRGAVRNNGGGHWNHSLFWNLMVPKSGGAPSGDVGPAIDKAFGDFAKFREIADEVGAILFADVAHIAGLIVGGAHPSPRGVCFDGVLGLFGTPAEADQGLADLADPVRPRGPSSG